MKMIIPEVLAPKVSLGGDDNLPPLVGALVAFPGQPMQPGREHNSVLIAFALDDDERTKLAAGEQLYILQMAPGDQMHPMAVYVGRDAACTSINVPLGTAVIVAEKVESARKVVRERMRDYISAMDAVAIAQSSGIIGGSEVDGARDVEFKAMVALDEAMTDHAKARVVAGYGLAENAAL